MANSFTSLSNDIAASIESAAPGIVQVSSRRRPSAGLVFAENTIMVPGSGFGDGPVSIRRGDGTLLEGQAVARARGVPLGVVRIADLGASPLTPAPEPRVGHLAIAIGRTWSGNVMASVTSVAVVGGPLRMGRGASLERVIRIAQPPHGAFVGGALIDGEGRVLGMITGGEIRGTTVVIPATAAWEAARSATASGGTQQGYLGVSTMAVRHPMQQAQDERSAALLVTGIVDGSPAAKAGLLVGDLLVSFAGAPLGEPEDLLDRLRGETPFKEVTLGVLRGGNATDVQVTPGARPEPRSRQ